jgi:DNA-binding response OmpR family regulator
MSDSGKPKYSHILVVDDEETARTSLGEILRLEGYQVDTAADGGAAINLINQQINKGSSHDLILLDLKMPGIDGLEVLRFITQLTPEPTDINRPTVILLTAHGSLESAIEALRYGAHDYLIKPSSPNQILKSVARALELRNERKQKSSLIDELEVSIKRLKAIDEPEASFTYHDDPKTVIHETKSETNFFHIPDRVNIDLARREITYPGNKNEKQTCKLTPTEGKLMQVFLENPQRVFTHRELVARVQGYDIKEWEAAEVLRPLVSRLRRKLSKIPGGEAWIVSIRGTGYVFDQNLK